MLEREQTHKSSKQIILCQPPRVLLLPHNHIPYSLLHLLPEAGASSVYLDWLDFVYVAAKPTPYPQVYF